MLTVKALKEQIATMEDKILSIVTVAQTDKRDNTPEELAEIDLLQGVGDSKGKIGELQLQLERAEKIENTQKQIALSRVKPQFDIEGIAPQGINAVVPGEVNLAAVKIPAKARARGRISAFIGPDAEKEAYIGGLFYMASMFGNERSAELLDGYGIQLAQTTGDNTKGGYLVPDILESTIIRNVENYGIARQKCFVMPIGQAGSITVPRVASEYTAEFVGEIEEADEVDATFDQVTLVAKKIMTLSKWSTELPEDAIVQIGDMVTRFIARAFANKEDSCLFNGTGASSFGGIVGLVSALQAGSIVDAAAGINTPAEVTFAVFEEAMGKLPEYDNLMPEWYCHKSFWANVMVRLANAAGGNTTEQVEGGHRKVFQGYPVNIVNVMSAVTPSQDLAGSIVCYFGDMERTAMFGDKRGVTIATDSSVYFKSDAIALKGTSRFDINVHERGDATNAGSMLGIKLTAA